MTVTVYTTPSCVQCESTKRLLNKNNVEYNVIDLSTNPDAHAMVLELGYTQAPIVFAGDDHWSGFRPDKIENLV